MPRETNTSKRGPSKDEAGPAVAANDQSRRLERQRGIKSFLTWSFFLAQATAADLLLQQGAAAKGDEEDSAAARSAAAAPEDAAELAPLRVGTTEPAIESASTTTPLTVPMTNETFSPPTAAIVGRLSAFDDHAALGGGIGGGVFGSSGSSAGAFGASNGDGSVPPGDNGSSSDLAGSVDTGGGSLIDLGLTIDTSGLIVSTELDLNLLDLGGVDLGLLDVSTSLTLEIGNLLGDPLGGLGNLLGTSDQSSILNAAELTGLSLGSSALLGLNSPVDGSTTSANILGGTPGLLGAPTKIALVTDGSEGVAAVLGLGASAGVLAFASPPTGEAASTDDLFAIGRYTEYNITLHTPPASDTAAVADSITLARALSAETSDAPPPAPDASELPVFADLQSLDEIGLRHAGA